MNILVSLLNLVNTLADFNSNMPLSLDFLKKAVGRLSSEMHLKCVHVTEIRASKTLTKYCNSLVFNVSCYFNSGLAACIDPDVRPKKRPADGTVELTDEPRLLTLFTTLRDVNHKLQIHRYRNRVATAQGKQGNWLSIFPDRAGNLRNLIKTQGKHREFRQGRENE